MKLTITFESRNRKHLETLREWILDAFETWQKDRELPTRTTEVLDAVIYTEKTP